MLFFLHILIKTSGISGLLIAALAFSFKKPFLFSLTAFSVSFTYMCLFPHSSFQEVIISHWPSFFHNTPSLTNPSCFSLRFIFFLFITWLHLPSLTAPSAMKSREVVVAAGSGVGVSFMVVPQTLGNIPITVRATTETASDVVTKQLLVKVWGHSIHLCSCVVVYWLGCMPIVYQFFFSVCFFPLFVHIVYPVSSLPGHICLTLVCSFLCHFPS